ncbi:MAG TPA: amidohydrolase family protein, partial [Geminicoccaceae bacterium]|nr:amidohydrolase family protein [Geminicoccaceae bacterium]
MDRDSRAGLILTPAGWLRGRIRFAEQVLALEPDGAVPPDCRILPGFIDLHVHGGGGFDCMDGAAATRGLAGFHARHGTTALLATTVTAPGADLVAAVAGIGAVAASPQAGEARVVGVHLEGPFINPGVLGAQPPFAIPPDLDLVRELLALAPMRVVTMAPEIDPDGVLLRCFVEAGVRVQLGHTAASYEQATAALRAGASGFTHLFNAMSALHHRQPGTAGAALAHAHRTEIILDLLHVAPGAVLAAARAIPEPYAVTDAAAPAGMPDGRYSLGRHTVLKQGDTVRLTDGTLASSVLTMDRALLNLLALGLPLETAALWLSTRPADHLGLADRGRLAPGTRADLVVVDGQGRLVEVLIEGEPVP